MPTHAIREEPTTPGTQVAEMPNRPQRPRVIISGSCSDSAFVAATVLISADTLTAEVAIRAWDRGPRHPVETLSSLRSDKPGRA